MILFKNLVQDTRTISTLKYNNTYNNTNVIFIYLIIVVLPTTVGNGGNHTQDEWVDFMRCDFACMRSMT